MDVRGGIHAAEPDQSGAVTAVRCPRCAPRNLRYVQAAASASRRLLMRAAPAAHLPAVPARSAALRFLRAIHGLLRYLRVQ